MQAVKDFTLQHTKEFFHNPVGKSLDLFFYALAFAFAVWLLKGAASILYYAVVSYRDGRHSGRSSVGRTPALHAGRLHFFGHWGLV